MSLGRSLEELWTPEEETAEPWMPEDETADEPIVVDEGECEMEEPGYYVVQDKPKAKARPNSSGQAAKAANLKPKPRPSCSSSISSTSNQADIATSAFVPWRSKRPRRENDEWHT